MKRKLFITALLLATTLTACAQTTQVQENTQISEQTENQTIEEADATVDNENETTEIEGFETTEEIKTSEYVNPYTDEIKELSIKANEANIEYARCENEYGYLVYNKEYQGAKTSEIYGKDFEILFSKLFKDFTNNHYTMEIDIENGVESYDDMQFWTKGKNIHEYRKLSGNVNGRYIAYIGGEYCDGTIQHLENIDDYLKTSEKLNDLWLDIFEYLSNIKSVNKNNDTYLFADGQHYNLSYTIDNVKLPEELQTRLNEFDASGTDENGIESVRAGYSLSNDIITLGLTTPHSDISIRIGSVDAVVE